MTSYGHPNLDAEALAVSRDYESGWQPFRCRSGDGLSLAGRDYGDPGWSSLPVACLPGLTRNGKDFHRLACVFSQDPERPRRVLTLDFRGRGDSDYDPDWTHYAPHIELDDVRMALNEAGIQRAAVIGTSRGGLVAMSLAASTPENVGALILNDIGPVLDAGGLARIAGYVMSPKKPENWTQAVDFVKAVNKAQFPLLSAAEWIRFAVQIYSNADGRPGLDFDTKLGSPLVELDFTQPLPTMWDVYDAFAATPLLVLRGANSDVLSEETLNEMASRHPSSQTMTVPDQGHAPLLWEAPTITRIAQFINMAEQ